MITAIEGMPPRVAEHPGAAAAWTDGRDDADRAHGHADAYRELFSLEAGHVPAAYRDGDVQEAAYRDGYATRAQDLIDDEN